MQRTQKLILSLGLLWSSFNFASPSKVSAVPEPKALEDELIWLSVDKDALRATLATLPPFPEKPVVLQDFRIAVGKAKGDKLVRGDNRTPEGIYFTLSHVPERQLFVPKYGRVAVPLDFPNLIDKMDKHTGYGIWLHGAGDDNRIAAENVTEGCVAFYNDDIVKLKNWLVPQQGIVMISADAKSINIPQDRQEIHDLTEKWFTAWTQRHLDDYINFYSKDFEHEGRSKQQYKKYKSRVFRSYKSMNVETTTLRVLTHAKYAVAIMNQTFKGDQRFHSHGRKVLYWRKEDGAWKIARETFNKTSLNKHNLSAGNLQLLRPMLTQKP